MGQAEAAGTGRNNKQAKGHTEMAKRSQSTGADGAGCCELSGGGKSMASVASAAPVAAVDVVVA